MPKEIRFHADAIASELGSTSIHRFINDLADNLNTIYKIVGINNPGFNDGIPGSGGAQFANLPAQAQFTVTGVDGKYLVAITNPQDINPKTVSVLKLRIGQDINQSLSPIIHQLQSATSTNFDNAAGVTTYGPSSQLSWEIQDPNQTKFWRLRSSFDGQNWNAWQIFSDAADCGPVGVASGFLRSTSAAPRSMVNTNSATADSIDAGTSATIRIYGGGGVGSSYTRFDGQGNQITTAGGTVLGAAYTTQYAVLLNAALTHVAFPTATQYINTLPDGDTYIATITTVASGGTGGTTGGGGSTDGGTTSGGNQQIPRL